MLAGIDWRIALASLGIWLLVAFISRYSSAAALAAAAAAPIAGYLFLGGVPVIAVLLAMSAILIWRHAANIQRLFAGTEGRIGGKKT
ncbi:Glycerol-3-phosphate acyltransferase [bioreactor metagenome]|uniref:Glycerol-3-phosphate acyltransferase n=1 Tax=bioreactor metagenome TaxID=1076179 RepID=A0A645JMV7_9ZZZZ